MSWVCTHRCASRNGTCAGSPVPSVTCWCHLMQESFSSARVPHGTPKMFTASEEPISRGSRKKAILRRYEQGWCKARGKGDTAGVAHKWEKQEMIWSEFATSCSNRSPQGDLSSFRSAMWQQDVVTPMSSTSLRDGNLTRQGSLPWLEVARDGL